jgi:Ulp1 family protease
MSCLTFVDQKWCGIRLSQFVVDEYVDLLKEQPNVSGDVVILSCCYWLVLDFSPANDLKKRVKDFCKHNEKKFLGKNRILWPVVVRGHFALLDISIKERTVLVYDSSRPMAKGWVPVDSFLHQLLVAAFPGKKFKVEFPDCRQQVNNDDCGVYTMANLRSLLFNRDVNGAGMPGSHMKQKRAGAVMDMRLKIFRELNARELSEWW